MDDDVEMAVGDAVEHPATEREARKPTTPAAKEKFRLRSMSKSPTGKTHIALSRENRNSFGPSYFALHFASGFFEVLNLPKQAKKRGGRK